MENVIQDALADSKTVRLDKIGSLYPRGKNQVDFVAVTHIKADKVKYKPGKRIINALKIP